jgi:UAA transporter family
MGTAPPKLAVTYYVWLVVLKTAAQGLTNLSMTQINYPAKVLFKSANPVITMFIGLVWFRRGYPIRDYVVVALLVTGLYVFLNGDATVSPQGTGTGVMLVSIAMLGSG